MFGVEKKIEAAARKAALFSVSGLLATIGVAFLTCAAWLLLTELRSELFAATVIGAIYLGFALIGFAVAASSKRKVVVQQPRDDGSNGLSPLQLVVVSFLQGIEEGARNKRKL
ncbi:phage holin family protein [Yoonia sp. MH D7]